MIHAMVPAMTMQATMNVPMSHLAFAVARKSSPKEISSGPIEGDVFVSIWRSRSRKIGCEISMLDSFRRYNTLLGDSLPYLRRSQPACRSLPGGLIEIQIYPRSPAATTMTLSITLRLLRFMQKRAIWSLRLTPFLRWSRALQRITVALEGSAAAHMAAIADNCDLYQPLRISPIRFLMPEALRRAPVSFASCWRYVTVGRVSNIHDSRQVRARA